MALARALAIEPTVLLLDEPFGALDAKVRKELRDWLRRLHDEVHVTTVFVTHDQEEALEVADRIVVINNGRIEQVGSPDELYDAPATEFVMSFLGPVTTLASTWSGRTTWRSDPPVRRRLRGPDRAVHPGRLRGPARSRAAGEPAPVLVTLTRADATAKGLAEGHDVWIKPVTGASQIPTSIGRRTERGSGAAAAGIVRIRASIE